MLLEETSEEEFRNEVDDLLGGGKQALSQGKTENVCFYLFCSFPDDISSQKLNRD